jgi:cytidylate kinase
MFQKATKTQSRLRLAIAGPSGSGKTYSALNIAQHLGNRIALIDTEHGSASKYADLFDFDTAPLTQHHPGQYIDLIKMAGQNG